MFLSGRVIDRGKCHADRGRAAGWWVKNKQDKRTLALPGMHNTHSGCGRQEGSAANREAHGPLSERCIRNCRPRGRRCFCRLPSPLSLSLSFSPRPADPPAALSSCVFISTVLSGWRCNVQFFRLSASSRAFFLLAFHRLHLPLL